MTRVLLVEDEPAVREACMRYLRHHGFVVATAADANEAVKRADSQPPDVLVCDWQLGGDRDGVEVARLLQARFSVPVIMITAHPLSDLRRVSADLDVREYFQKPISLSTLVDALQSATA